MAVKDLLKKNYVILMDNEGNDILPVNDGNSVFVGDGSVKLNDKLVEVEGKVSANEGEIARVESEYKAADLALEGKISAVEGRVGTLETDKADKTQVAQDIATAKQELQGAIDGKADKSHRHGVSEIDGLGTVATLNVGTAEGNVPVLGVNGKLDESMIPAIAINECFDAESQEDAMTKPVQNGDVVFVEGVAYICVKSEEVTFEKRFRPLNSATDTITRGEVESKLATKVDNTEFGLYKEATQSELDKKALASEVGVVGELQTSAKVVVGAINEVKAIADGAEAKATQNASDLAGYKVEVEGKLAEKADKSDLTPINEAIAKKVETIDFDAYKLQVTGELAGKASAQHVHDEYALKTEVAEVEGKVDANASAVATKVETTVFEGYKTEAKGITDGLETRLAKAEGEIAGLAGAIKFRTFDVNSDNLA